ncbi:IPT/TIG domain-containing protein [Rufibacter latericius]|uniref:T9SS C-terminal target domain-containing protein n=1 Tax=Rufibacter latericius TaxID=2487040 RepID=A0A3M9MET9_9BACT|nr:IPT/TIG domain-containing protein [Rufibacter latericius]RNI23647.1 T9SS C-terminal target domain-containing protein [Rufibacter latericius]
MEKNLLRRSASGENNASRVWLFLVLILLGLMPMLEAQAQVGTVTTLPTNHNGPWNTLNKTGWSQTGLAADPGYNLTSGDNTDQNNIETTDVALFETEGSFIQINYSDSPEKLTFLYNTFGGQFTGSFVVEELTKEGTYSLLWEAKSIAFTDDLDASYFQTLTPSKDSKGVRFRMASIDPSSESGVLIDQISITKRGTTPEIDVTNGGTNVSNNSTFTFPGQNTKTESLSEVFKIKNLGFSDLVIGNLALNDPLGQFKIVELPSKSSLLPGEETTLKMAFKPSSTGPKTASISFTTNDADETNYTINLSGTGIFLSPVINSFSPSSGGEGTTVEIFGSNLINTSQVLFHEGVQGVGLNIVSDNLIKIQVPSGAKTGKITVKNPASTVLSANDFTFILKPTIQSVTPSSALVGSSITITGQYLDNLVSVTVNGQAATIISGTDKQINTQVPNGASSGNGKIVVTTKGGAAETPFTVLVPSPTITSLSPSFGPVGTLVTILGTNLAEVTSVSFNSVDAPEFGYTPEDGLQVYVPEGVPTGDVTLKVTSSNGTTATSPFKVTVGILSWGPTSGKTGTEVSVTVTNGPSDTRIRFKTATGISAPLVIKVPGSFSTTTTYKVKVPNTAVTGRLEVFDNVSKVVVLETSEDFVMLPPSPSISGLSKTSGPVGELVTINGSNLINVQNIKFNSTLATEFYKINDNSWQVFVPTGATDGSVSLTTPSGTATSAAVFVVTTPPTPTLKPISGSIGELITISGDNLIGIQSITFNGVSATPFNDDNPTALEVTVPEGATTGPLVVTTTGGSGTTNFTLVVPTNPLPVELIEFNGKSSPDGVILAWKTASEQENSHFEVQATYNPKQKEFTTVQKVGSKATNSQVLLSYETIDRTPVQNSVIYYRLKQVDLDGKFEYSKVIAVKTQNINQATNTLKAYPNPFREGDNVKVEVLASQAGSLTITLYYVTGKKAYEQVVAVDSGISVIELPVSNVPLPTGIYILKTELNGSVTTSRVVKQ